MNNEEKLPENAIWYYQRNNQQTGPVDAAVVERLISSGDVTRSTKVWREGMTGWQPAMSTELGAMFPKNVPPPVSPPAITVPTQRAAEQQNNFQGMGNELAKGIHASKSYTGAAFLTLVLYYVGFYIGGLICNLIYLSSANKSKRISGVNPSGRGCLIFLLWTHLIIPILAIIALFGMISVPFLN
ncbi:MAG: DUF4339 domain-containing protein [Candidatus Cloacimonetes bacterium]|nr:DUF4339 domain-containing protein [Candidatus Cloacimonadota bacterium]